MSTRGVVAVGTLDKWRGVYNHSDSYPTWLAKEIYEHLIRERIQGGKTLKEIGESILLFDNWSNYLGGGICEYCGKQASQPHSISGSIIGKQSKAGKYPDPSARHHKHNDITDVEKEQYTSNIPVDDARFIEWVYIINPTADVVHVIDTRQAKTSWKQGRVGDLRFDSVPDFQSLECGEHFERCGHYAWSHFPELQDDQRYGHLGTAEYLGYRKIDADDAYGVEIDGVEYRISGGMTGGYSNAIYHGLLRRFDNGKHGFTGRRDFWYSSLRRGGSESTFYAPLFRMTRTGKRVPVRYKGVKLLYPAVCAARKAANG